MSEGQIAFAMESICIQNNFTSGVNLASTEWEQEEVTSRDTFMEEVKTFKLFRILYLKVSGSDKSRFLGESQFVHGSFILRQKYNNVHRMRVVQLEFVSRPTKKNTKK